MSRAPDVDGLRVTPPSRPSHLRWWICFIIFLATMIIYSDRQFLSLLKTTLANEIHWNDTQFGTVNSCFLGAYAIGLLFFGRIIDRVGVKAGYAATVLLWSLAALSHTLVTTVGGFMIARIFLGLSEAGNFPAAVKTIALWFPQAERAFATTLFNSGANVGAIIAPLLVAWLLQFSTWHAPFFVAGAAGVMWVAAWWLFYAAPERHSLVSPEELAYIRSNSVSPSQDAPAVPWLQLFVYPQAWSFFVAKFLTDPVWFFLLFWLPDYFKKTRHLDLKASWPHLMTIYAIVTVLSLVGGYLPGYLVRRGWSVTRARKTGLFLYALFVLPVLTVGGAGDWTAVVIIGIVGAAHQAWSANLFTTVSDMFPRNCIASLVGIGSMTGAVGSMLFQFLCGHILDLYGAEHAQAGYFLLFSYAAFAYLVAFGLQHLLAPSFEPLLVAKKNGVMAAHIRTN
jgi:ACS family hexuronate transporter-like MFS transporter